MKKTHFQHPLSRLLSLVSILLFLAPSLDLAAWHSLTVGDPRNSWRTYAGAISEAGLRVEPKGLYMDYELTLSFSTLGTPWTSASDTTEVVLDFELPVGAIVYDSWLWIEGEPERAEILDQWTASLIYESIVNRRRDPSILTKQQETQYQLRVFPMAGHEERKVKICYMLPADWSLGHVGARLPLDILRLSTTPLQLSLDIHVEDPWGAPVGLETAQGLEEVASGHYATGLEFDEIQAGVKLGFVPPLNEQGYFLAHSAYGGDDIYELALFPRVFLEPVVGKKLMLLLDYEAGNSSCTVEELVDEAHIRMLSTMGEGDSFNLVVSGLEPYMFNESWTLATRQNIDEAFAYARKLINEYSNLTALISRGIGFIQDQDLGGQMVLLTNSDQFNDISVANGLILDILEMMEEDIPMHIGYFQDRNYPTTWSSGKYFRGNEYLFSNLAKQSGGSFQHSLDGKAYQEVLASGLKHSSGVIKSLDLHTGMQDGFCHSRYAISRDESLAYLYDPILQIGKFKGDFPMKLEFYGIYEDELIGEQMEIPADNSHSLDSLAAEAWTGRYIQELEGNYPSNEVISEIIYQSLRQRVLSRYTAFLCLEPGMSYNPDDLEDGEDPGGWVISDEMQDAAETKPLKAYPNPFSETIQVEVYCKDPEGVRELAIYNLSGQLVHRFLPEVDLKKGSNVLSWNGVGASGGAIEAGIYLLVYQDGDSRYTIKLVKQ